MKEIVKVYGPYIQDKDTSPRRFVILRYVDGTCKTTSYARHLMEQHLQRELGPNEHVDHVDEDPMNDVISNYQILTKSENSRKAKKPAGVYAFTCEICGVETQRELRFVVHNWNLGKAGPFCGKRCAGIWSTNKQYKKRS